MPRLRRRRTRQEKLSPELQITRRWVLLVWCLFTATLCCQSLIIPSINDSLRLLQGQDVSPLHQSPLTEQNFEEIMNIILSDERGSFDFLFPYIQEVFVNDMFPTGSPSAQPQLRDITQIPCDMLTIYGHRSSRSAYVRLNFRVKYNQEGQPSEIWISYRRPGSERQTSHSFVLAQSSVSEYQQFLYGLQQEVGSWNLESVTNFEIMASSNSNASISIDSFSDSPVFLEKLSRVQFPSGNITQSRFITSVSWQRQYRVDMNGNTQVNRYLIIVANGPRASIRNTFSGQTTYMVQLNEGNLEFQVLGGYPWRQVMPVSSMPYFASMFQTSNE